MPRRHRRTAGRPNNTMPLGRVVERIRKGPAEDPHTTNLSVQERRILDPIAERRTSRQIATEMTLAEKTVKNYINNPLPKLRMTSRTEAAVYATRRANRNLVDVDLS